MIDKDVSTELRMSAYYYDFHRTGCPEIDRILSAVACAGKAYHHTESWTDESLPYQGHKGRSPIDWIQNAANDAASALFASPPLTVSAAGEDDQSKTDRALAALDAMAILWAAEVRLHDMVDSMLAAPSLLHHDKFHSLALLAFTEGAYRHHCDVKDGKVPHMSYALRQSPPAVKDGETPRTDAACWKYSTSSGGSYSCVEHCKADFARNLERELNALRQSTNVLAEALIYISKENNWEVHPDTGYYKMLRPGGPKQNGIFLTSHDLAPFAFARDVLRQC